MYALAASDWKHIALQFVTAVYGTLAMAQPTITYTDLNDYGVSLITPASSNFKTEIGRLVTPQALQAMQSILPYSVLIRNSTGTPWIAVCVTWELKNPQGQTIVHSMSIQTMLDDQSRMLQPGEYLLMAPKSGVSRNLGTGSSTTARGTLRWADEALFRQQHSIRVTLDAIVLATGLLWGPDAQATGAKLNAWTAAERDTINALRSLPREELRATTSTLATTQEPSAAAGITNHYSEHRQRTARSFLTLLENQGEDALIRTLNAMSSAARIPTIRR